MQSLKGLLMELGDSNFSILGFCPLHSLIIWEARRTEKNCPNDHDNSYYLIHFPSS